jgi:hypothetical protein
MDSERLCHKKRKVVRVRGVSVSTSTDTPAPPSVSAYVRDHPFHTDTRFDRSVFTAYRCLPTWELESIRFNTWVREHWWHKSTANPIILASIRAHYRPPVSAADQYFLNLPILKALLSWLGSRSRLSQSLEWANELTHCSDNTTDILGLLRTRGLNSTEDVLGALIAILYEVPSTGRTFKLRRYTMPCRSPSIRNHV